MSSPEARERWRGKRTQQVKQFCDKHDMTFNPMNNGYQLRVENLVDFYPTNGRYCILQSGERGDFETINDMKTIMLKALPSPKHLEMYDKPPANPFGEPVYVSGVKTMTEAEYNKPLQRLRRWWYAQPLFPEPNTNRMTPRLFILLAIYCFLVGVVIALCWVIIWSTK